MKIISKHILTGIYASGLALLMLLVLYVMDITGFSTEGEVKLLKYINIAEQILKSDDTPVPEDVLLINVNYDKTLVPVHDEFGVPMGRTDITDREKLLQFLQAAEKNGNYKYILLDIFFEKGYSTPFDSLLFHQIAGMPRIVIPKHRGRILADSILLPKAAYADYRTDIEESGFVKYPLFVKNEATLAAVMYEDLYDRKLESHLLYAKDGRKLMHKSIFPTLDLSNIQDYGKDRSKNILNLSEDLLSLGQYGMLEEMLDGKYLIIGAFHEKDIHATFRGDVPGCLIHFNVFLSLAKGKHCIRAISVIFLWSVFFLMSINCLTGKNLFNPKSRLLTILLSWLNYSIILAVICVISYICFHSVFNILIVATAFELLKQLIHLKK